MFGACMFDFLKVSKYGMDAVLMKSDFVIDHPLPKLSRLLIMGVLSSEFKDELDIRYKHECGVIATSVFTDKPVSMKYRECLNCMNAVLVNSITYKMQVFVET